MKNRLFEHKFLGDSSYNKGWELALLNFQILEQEKKGTKSNGLESKNKVDDIIFIQSQNQASC